MFATLASSAVGWIRNPDSTGEVDSRRLVHLARVAKAQSHLSEVCTTTLVRSLDLSCGALVNTDSRMYLWVLL